MEWNSQIYFLWRKDMRKLYNLFVKKHQESCVKLIRGSLHVIVINMLNIIVSEFKFQLLYCIHFWTNTLGKGTNSFNPPPAMGLIVSLLFFYKDGYGIKKPIRVVYWNKKTKTDETKIPICSWKTLLAHDKLSHL